MWVTVSEFLMDLRLYAGYSDRSITYSPLIVSGIKHAKRKKKVNKKATWELSKIDCRG